jgi:hypothetical protein
MDSTSSTKSNALHSHNGEETAQSRMAKGIRSYRAYGESGDLGQLDDAIRHTREGSRLVSQGHESFTKNLIMVAALLKKRHEQSEEMKDLEEAIDTARRAVQSTPPDHPNLAMHLSNLGTEARGFERKVTLHGGSPGTQGQTLVVIGSSSALQKRQTFGFGGSGF